MSILSTILTCIILLTSLWSIFLSLRFLVIVCKFMCRGIKPYSIPGIHISLSLEQAGLVFTTNIYFFKQSMLINNKNSIKRFKGVILTIFLVHFLVGAESQHENVELCT
jgi:hypothetical protein